MNNNIILIGFMGTGKTAIGKRLADILKMEFYDSDHEIEKVANLTIEQIFKKHGEVRFRSEEKVMLRKLAKNKKSVIATGGGVVLDPENINILKDSGVLITLKARPDVIYERVQRRNNRPLLKKGDPYENIIKLLEEREGLYNCSDYILDTSDLSFEEIIEAILSFLKEKNKIHG